MDAPEAAGFNRCLTPNCGGSPVPGGYCLAHANPGPLDDALKEFSETGRLDARGVPVTPDLLRRIFEAAPTVDGRPRLSEADFSGAAFKGDAVFHEVILGTAKFMGTTFEDVAGFYGVTFEDDAGFVSTTFEGGAVFNDLIFQQQAWFSSATFRAAALFVDVRFWGRTSFRLVTFEGAVAFDRATFRDRAEFDEASFQRPVDLGPMAVAGEPSLDRIVFERPVQLEVAAWRLSCWRTRFRAGGHILVAWAEISLQGAEIPAPLILSAQPAESRLVERVAWLDQQVDKERAFPDPMPSLVSVMYADVAGLVVADIDLHECRFAGAHHLDQLQITTSDLFSTFHRVPALWGRGRRVLVEECEWRQAESLWQRRWRHTTSELFRSPLVAGSRRSVVMSG
jgi:uncharacterized protein YjbI with pentapeptide repeats